MAIGKRRPRPRKPRPNQVGVSLPPEAARELRARAAELEIAPATLARRLLVRAIAERSASEGLAEDADMALGQLLAVLAKLARSHRNATLMLLRQSGMSIDEVNDWARQHLPELPPE